MLSLNEWLTRIGFTSGNPFALKQADKEGELLQEYFVEPPAYNAMLDQDIPQSSILHAARGAGKSATRRMFEAYCQNHASRLRPLLVHIVDWMPVVERVATLDELTPHDYLREILRQVVVALARSSNQSALVTPRSMNAQSYLVWLCTTFNDYLLPDDQQGLAAYTWMIPQLGGYTLGQFSMQRHLSILMTVLRELGFQRCYLLVDGVDELLETVGDWDAGARLLAPLVGNVQLGEIPGLAFKYFIPSEIVAVLRWRNILREDRIACLELEWTNQLLTEMLRSRLRVFSDQVISSLASIAEPQLRDIDDRLIQAAAGSPRRLLNLGEWVLQTCATDADDNHMFIQPEHLEHALIQATALYRPSAEPLGQAVQSSAPDVPQLRLQPDGSIWRGSEAIENWRKITSMQRRFLQYLFEHRGTLCPKQAIIDHVWRYKPNPAGDDSLRKLVDRVIAIIEPDPSQPVYIQKISGGYYRLDNAADEG